MPVLRFPLFLRGESDLTLLTKRRLGYRIGAACARFAGIARETVAANPELFFPVFLLFVWQITAIAAKPRTLGIALVMTLLLLIYGYRVMGKTHWLRRVGWVSPCQGFWLYTLSFGRSPDSFTSPSAVFHRRIGSSWPACPDQCWRKSFLEAFCFGWSSRF